MARVITLMIVGALLLPVAASAQTSEWSVTSTSERDARISARYVRLLLQQPDRPAVLRLLLRRTSPADLDKLIASLREKADDRAKTWVLIGHLELGRQKTSAAITAYERAVEIAPESSAARASLGQALSATGETERAAREIERALELANASGKAKLLRRLADLTATAGDDLACATWLQRLADLRPNDRSLLVELADAQLRARRYDLSLVTHQRVVDLSRGGKSRAEALIELGKIHLRMQNPHDAEPRLREALRLIAPGGWMRREAWMGLIDASRRTGQLAEVYRELAQEWARPTLRDALTLADLADELSLSEDALKWVEAAIRAEPTNIEARRRLIARLDPVTDAERIDKLYRELIALSPDDVGEQVERIEWMFFRSQRPDEALAALRELEDRCARPEDLVEVATAWLRLGVPDVALRIHGALEASAPTNPRHLETYAELLLDLGRKEAGQAVLDRLIATAPDKASLRLRAAELAQRHKALPFAARQLERVIRDHPSLLDARQRIAVVYEAQERWPEALAQWETLFDAGKDHATGPILEIVRRTVFIGDTAHSPDERALQRWEKKFEADASVRIGEVLIEVRKASGQPAAAQELAKSLIEREPKTMRAKDRLAWLRIAQRHRDLYDLRASVALLERMGDAFAEWRSMLFDEAATLAAQLPALETKEVFARLLARAPNDAALWATIGTYWAAYPGEEARAILHLRRARALNPQLTTASFELVYVLRKQGQDDEAWAVLIDMLQRTRSSSVTLDVAFNALDLASTDAQLMQLERMLPTLEGRVGARQLTAVAVAIYYALYTHSGDQQLFEKTRTTAVRHVVAALASKEPGDVALAAELVERFERAEIEQHAKTEWPADGRTWSAMMVSLVARSNDPWFADRFTEATHSRDRRAMRAAVMGLGLARAASSVPRLIEVFEAREFGKRERTTIAASLGRIDVAAGRAALASHMRTNDWEERQIAVWGLGQGQSRESAEALRRVLADRDATVAKLAAVMMRRSHAGLRALIAACWDGDVNVRRAAEHGLRVRVAPDVWTTAGDDLLGSEIALTSHRDAAANVSATEPAVAAFVGHEQLLGELAPAGLPAPTLDWLASTARDAADRPEHAPTMRRIVESVRPQLRRIARTETGPRLAHTVELLPWAERREDAQLVLDALERVPRSERPRIVEQLRHYRWQDVRATLLVSADDDSVDRRNAALRALAAFKEASRDPAVVQVARRVAVESRDEGQVAAIELLRAARDADSADLLADAFERSGPRARAAIRSTLQSFDTPAARKHLVALEVQPELPVCAGNPEDLADLLADDCRGAVATPEF